MSLTIKIIESLYMYRFRKNEWPKCKFFLHNYETNNNLINVID